MKITLSLSSLSSLIYLFIDEEKKQVRLNGRDIELDIKVFSKRLLAIVSSWEHKMINPMIVDGQAYSVKFELNNKTLSYQGKNKFPDNYYQFIELLREFNIC